MSQSPAISAPPTFRGSYYDNALYWKLATTHTGFRVIPHLPWISILFCNAVFVAATYGWIALNQHYAKPGDDHRTFITLGICLGIFTCILFTAIGLFRYLHARSKGPLLTYDNATQTLTLPRHNRSFPASRVQLQWLYLTGMQPQSAGGSELQLVAQSETTSPEETFLLDTSIYGGARLPFGHGLYDKLLQKIAAHSAIQITRIPMANRETPRQPAPHPTPA